MGRTLEDKTTLKIKEYNSYLLLSQLTTTVWLSDLMSSFNRGPLLMYLSFKFMAPHFGMSAKTTFIIFMIFRNSPKVCKSRYNVEYKQVQF